MWGWETDEANEATFWRTIIVQAIEEDCEKDFDVYRFTVSQRAAFSTFNEGFVFPEIEMIGPVNVSYQLYDSTGALVQLEAKFGDQYGYVGWRG